MSKARPPLPPTVAQAFALISRSTLHKVERGDPRVSPGVYATVLQGYGMAQRLAFLAEARFDRQGLALKAARLPLRVRGAR